MLINVNLDTVSRCPITRLIQIAAIANFSIIATRFCKL